MRKRNCRVEIYFTKDELESLTKKVRKSGLSRESFCLPPTEWRGDQGSAFCRRADADQ